MIRYIRVFVHRILDQLFYNRTVMKSVNFIDFSDIFDKNINFIETAKMLKEDFKSYSSMDDYNEDFLAIFQTYRKDFFLDYSQKDGHFRV